MVRLRLPGWLAPGLMLLLPGAFAAGQCAAYDFEGAAVGTIVTSQYAGVTFSAVGDSCDGTPPVRLRIAEGFYGDTFASQVVLIDAGCPDFSPDFLRMVFSDPQREVRFTMGLWGSGYLYQIRVYSTASGSGLVESHTIELPGTGFVGAQRLVVLEREEGDIRRIEIESSSLGFEAIDNLVFGQDTTPPTVYIDSPAQLACVCGQITLEGVVCDFDGAYDRDRLEYRRLWPQPQVGWTLVREYVGSPVCQPNSLYTWNTATVMDGIYVLRVTSLNACSLAANAELTVQVNNAMDTVRIDKPTAGTVVGGAICLDGTVWDRACFDYYKVEFRPGAGGAWTEVDPNVDKYYSTATNEKLADWVVAPDLPDGAYELRVRAWSDCTAGDVQDTETMTVMLDNTPPTATMTAPSACTTTSGTVQFFGTALDANLDVWELAYYDPFTANWENIATGLTPVNGGLLGAWDTTGLASCSYCVRLRVWDTAVLGLCEDVSRHRTDYYVAVAIGPWASADLDIDGDVDIADFAEFEVQFTGP